MEADRESKPKETHAQDLRRVFDEACGSAGVDPDVRDRLFVIFERKLSNDSGSLDAAWRFVLVDYREWEDFHAAGRGDEAASERFYGAWRSRATSYLRHLGGCRGSAVDVDDLFQEFCYQLTRQGSQLSFSWGSLFRSYCHAILRNAHRQHLRAASTRRERNEAELARETESPLSCEQAASSPSPSELFLQGERYEHFLEGFRTLNDVDRRILVKRFVEGASMREVAELFGHEANWAEQRVSRLRKRLRKVMAERADSSRSVEAS
ncbi:MAG: sigma-70 family RNA polymerase sigma factor [Acidobacteriota bacterium]